MAIVIRTPSGADWRPLAEVDARAFGITYSPQDLAEREPVIDLDRFRIAMDGSDIVGVAGSFAFDVTVPGGATVPMGGVTWVSVATTHRRQGILGQLMSACHEDIDARGEPVAMLTASEGGIYERFGYAAATKVRVTELDRRLTGLRPEHVPAGRDVRFLDGEAAADHVQATWARFHRLRAGEVTRDAAWHHLQFTTRSRPQDGMSVSTYLTHPDGYAVYRVESHWNDGQPAHVLHLGELVAVTAEAHLALWHALLGVDLVGPIRYAALPVDDPLPYLLLNPRALRTTDLNDGIWVNVRDVRACFGARTYATTDRLVIEVDGVRHAISGSPHGGDVVKVRTRPDLTMTHAVLGALLLGGVSATELRNGRRLQARSEDVLRRADLMFTTATAPHCQTSY